MTTILLFDGENHVDGSKLPASRLGESCGRRMINESFKAVKSLHLLCDGVSPFRVTVDLVEEKSFTSILWNANTKFFLVRTKLIACILRDTTTNTFDSDSLVNVVEAV